MNDINKSDADIADIENESVSDIDLDELYNEVEIDDDVDLDDNSFDESAVPPVVAPVKKSGREKLWLVLTLLFFILALVSSVIIPPAISTQTQRVDQVAEIVDKVNLTNISATQALTANGSFEGVKTSLKNAQSSVDKLVSPRGGLEGIASVLFNNKSANESVKASWSKFKSTADKFIKTDKSVGQVKRLAVELDGSIATTISDSVGFVEAVAKEGRNKSGGSSKDKYLFLTTEASDLNGILSRLSASMRGYFNTDSNLEELSGRQNNLMVRLQDTLSRVVSNAGSVVGTAAEPLQERYKALVESQVSTLGQQAVSVVNARNSLDVLRSESSELSNAVNTASNQTSFVKLMAKLSTLLPLIFGLLAGFSLWRYINAQTRDLVEHDADLEETLADQQESILKLLDEMSALADGDLTVEAEVTDQITGAIADSVNFAVMEMRELVTQINSVKKLRLRHK